MLRIRSRYCFIFFFLLTDSLFCQDLHFSQFFATPLFINPAYTGDADGSMRFANLYRSQWRAISKPYSSLSLSLDNHLGANTGGGLLLLYDESGLVGLTSVKFYVSGSYKKLFSNHYFRLGIQLGLVHKFYNPALATFPSQFDMSTGYYNPDLPSNEAGLGETMTYFDACAGFLWKVKIGITLPEVGASFQHINMPVESFGGDGTRLPVRINGHAGIKISTYSNITLVPSALYSYNAGDNELLSGLMASFGVASSRHHITSFSTGLYCRNGYKRNNDAAVAFAGLNFIKLNVGLSYDITLSELQTINKNKGGFEISIIYSNIENLVGTKAFPCERY